VLLEAGVAVGELIEDQIEARPQCELAKRTEEMSLRELMDDACREGLLLLLAILDLPAEENVELARLQANAARDLLSLRIP